MNTMTHFAGKAVLRGETVKPWYRHRWPWLLIAGPFAVVIASCYTGWIAYTRPDALVVDDYYKQGKAINQDLRRDRAATNLALQAAMHYDAANGKIFGKVSSDGKPYVGKIVVRLVHSTQPEKDVLLRAALRADGSFDVALPMLEIAHWQVVMENERQEWRLTGAWNWPQQRSTELKADAPPADQ